jgi:hypothetical protein
VHGADWAAACAETEARLEAALPRAAVDAAYAAWLPSADAEPKEILATGSGWGALEVVRGHYELPGTPFDEAGLGDEQRPWLELLRTGEYHDLPGSHIPGPSLVGPHWRALLEASAPTADSDYHLGVAQWRAGDRSQAVRSWERSLRSWGADSGAPWVLRCLAVAEAEAGETARAADLYHRAFTEAVESAWDARYWKHVHTALAREAIPALLAAGRADDAAAVLEALRPSVRDRGRFRLLQAQVLLAQGDARAARAVFDAGFEVDDLREGEETLERTWYAVAEQLMAGGGPVTEDVRARARAAHPLPPRYDYRMRPHG